MYYAEIFRKLARIRLVEETLVAEYGKQQMRCPVHLCLGQEAVSAGAASALRPTDALWGTHRSHGPYIAAGADLFAFFSELYGKETGCCAGRGGSMHVIDEQAGFWGAVPIVASTIPLATGAAFAFQRQKLDSVSMVIFGEGATEEGVFHESVQYAALQGLPVVYVCENNDFAVNTPLKERRPSGFSLTRLVEGHGLPALQGDGNDVFAVHTACAEAVARARKGQGPTFLEFSTYRWVEHCGPNDDHHLPCRNAEDLQQWKKRCPVQLAQTYLLNQGLLDVKSLEDILQQEHSFVQQALARAQKAAFPSAHNAAELVYAEKAHRGSHA